MYRKPINTFQAILVQKYLTDEMISGISYSIVWRNEGVMLTVCH